MMNSPTHFIVYCISNFNNFRPIILKENNIRELEFHVDAHLATTRTCPICQQRFDPRNEDGFKKHVDVR